MERIATAHKLDPKPDRHHMNGKCKIAQKEAQINDITEEIAQKYGYQTKELSELTDEDLKR